MAGKDLVIIFLWFTNFTCKAKGNDEKFNLWTVQSHGIVYITQKFIPGSYSFAYIRICNDHMMLIITSYVIM